MTTYIALLRGINVAGQKKIKMADLKAMFEKLDFSEVVTYIQSGNVLFSTTKTPAPQLQQTIHSAVQQTFGFEVPVLVLDHDKLQRLANNNLYKNKEVALNLLHMTLLATPPEAAAVEAVQRLEYPGEYFTITPEVVYLYLPNGYGRTKLNNNFFESKLKVQATTRNLKSIYKILELAKDRGT